MYGKNVIKSQTTRRDFIRSSGITLAGAAAMMAARPVFAATGGSDELRVGLIGCGGRGTGAARNALLADPNAKLYALADVFEDQVKVALEKMKQSEAADRVVVDSEHQFVGFDAYQKLVECCDVVVLGTPPVFRPEHLEAAINAGCHVFAEKPIAVDGPGVRSVIRTCKKAAARNLNVVSGLCYRYQFAKQETAKRIHDGALGDIVAMECVYNTGTLWHKGREPEWSEMEYQLRNWLYFDWASGDHISEQHIHSLDKIMWVMQDKPPVKATSSGGRVQRVEEKYGNVYDHFNTVYEWENGVKCFSSCRQWSNASTNVSDNIYGTKGRSFFQDHIIETYGGETWKYEPTGPDDMYQNELDALFKAIRKGEVINNGDYMCKSTLMAILGRMAAYSGKTVTWEEALNSELSLAPETWEWGDLPTRPVPVPGQTKAF